MGRIGEPKREIHIPVPPPATPIEEPLPDGEPVVTPAEPALPAEPVLPAEPALPAEPVPVPAKT
jgi:hypothetical protein